MLKLGLVGQHITKSLTQTFFHELSEIYNIKLSYELFDMFNQNISIEEKLKELSDKGYMGLNITQPYKEEIFQIINSKSEEVKLVQSINTVMIDNSISAYNTDYLGFRHILKSNDIQNNINVLVIGSGGVGRSVANACGKELNANIFLYDIDLLKSEKLHLGLKENCRHPAR